ncbi:MAG: hypothetical protein RLZZ627_1421, partial [Pseudomonadota bacterium]|jgi:outer membrane biosynthesis protein TonB
MFEFLFFITALYLGYVAKEAYQAVARAEKGEPVFVEKPKPAAPAPKVAAKPAEAPKKPAPAAKVEAPKPVAAKPAAPVKATAPKKAPAPAKAASPKPAAKPKAAKAAEGKVVLAEDLKNPETGEVTPVPANYRFAKKWIKDALVEEKLLDRVYKPNELDDATSAKVKDAIDKLRSLKKYQA